MNKKPSSMPIIGLTTYGVNDTGKYDLPREYIDSVRRAGGAVLLLPPGESNWRVITLLLDGLILTGGGDIDPQRYNGGHHEMVYNIDTERDESECQLAEYALESGLPTLGICRGAQMLNIVSGGSLYVHLPDKYGEQIAHRQPPREPVPHDVQLEGRSRLADIFKTDKFSCASWHHQALNDIPEAYAITARAADGVVEAIEHRQHPWLVAVQWHPELTAAEDPLQQELFNALVRQGRRNGE